MRRLLISIVNDPQIYARFLNTVSLLEYMGARKILKSQRQEVLTEKLLDHAAEEIRHAQVLKRAAKKLAPKICDTYAPESLLCGQQAQAYFQTVDHAAADTLGITNPSHAYLYTTWLIEVRALKFYTAWEDILRQIGQRSVFRGILKEEEKHLQEILQWLQVIDNHEHHMALLQGIEEAAFAQLLQAWTSELNATAQTLLMS